MLRCFAIHGAQVVVEEHGVARCSARSNVPRDSVSRFAVCVADRMASQMKAAASATNAERPMTAPVVSCIADLAARLMKNQFSRQATKIRPLTPRRPSPF